MTPFRNEKNSNWEGAYRVPAMVRWPGKIKPGSGLKRHRFAPRLDANPSRRGRRPDVNEKLLKGYKVGDMTYKVHLDGYNLLPYLTGRSGQESAQGVLLLFRRRRPDRPALRQLEICLPGTAGAGNVAGLGRAIHPAARAEDLQSPARPVRARQTSRRTPITTGCWTTPSCWCRPDLCRQVPGDVQGLSAAPEGRELHTRSGDGEAETAKRRLNLRCQQSLGLSSGRLRCAAARMTSLFW